MKNFSKKAAAVATGVVFCALGQGCLGGRAAEGFGDPVTLRADSIAIDQVLQPRGSERCGDKAVMLSPKSENIFWVYRMPDFKFLYACGKEGGGPDDFARARFVSKGVENTELYVRSGANLRAFSVGEKAFGKRAVLGREKAGSYMTACVAAGGRWVLSLDFIPGDPLGRKQLEVMDSGDGKIRDSVMLHSFSVEQSGANGGVMTTRYNDAVFAVRGSRVAVVYKDSQRIDFYDITSEGRLKTAGTVGRQEPDEETIERIKAGEKDTDRTMMAELCATENYLYLLEMRVKVDMAARKVDFVHSRVKVYDWEGAEVRLFELEKPASQMIVQGDDSRIFAYNVVTGDFDKVYVYKPEF